MVTVHTTPLFRALDVFLIFVLAFVFVQVTSARSSRRRRAS
jgi:hypothetical protein